MHSDEFAIAVTHIRPRKSGTVETLLATQFTRPKTKFAVLLDRHTKRSTYETQSSEERLQIIIRI